MSEQDELAEAITRLRQNTRNGHFAFGDIDAVCDAAEQCAALSAELAEAVAFIKAAHTRSTHEWCATCEFLARHADEAKPEGETEG